jgi:hypothetical protein
MDLLLQDYSQLIEKFTKFNEFWTVSLKSSPVISLFDAQT